MEQYNVTGMSCAACSARVEKAVSAVEGVESCSVSLLTNSMGVEGNASPEAIISAVENAGYGASLKGVEKVNSNNSVKDTETPKIRNRLIASIAFLLPLMYISMGHMMWNFPLPPFMENNHIAMGLAEMLLAAIVMVINQKFFISGFKGVIHRAPNMDTLVALGSGASFIYSTVQLFLMTVYQLQGNAEKVMACMEEFYFESVTPRMANSEHSYLNNEIIRGFNELLAQYCVDNSHYFVNIYAGICDESGALPAAYCSDPVSEGGIVVAVRAEDLGMDTEGIHISDFNDAKYTIGAATGASGMLMAEQYLPNAKLILYDDIMPAVESVRLGKIDGFIYERNQLEIVLQNDVTGVRILDEDVGDTIEVAVGISRAASDPELKKKLNAFLAEKKADGTIDELYDRWMY